MAGQIIYHLLAAAHATAAPWPVVVVVSCMPVAVLGLAAALTHLLRRAAEGSEEDTAPAVQVSAPPWTDAETAAAEALARSVGGGNPLTPNALQTRFRLTRAETARVVAAVTASSNGHPTE
jgi:hypothetical protein